MTSEKKNSKLQVYSQIMTQIREINNKYGSKMKGFKNEI